jgi:hypothetical protein
MRSSFDLRPLSEHRPIMCVSPIRLQACYQGPALAATVVVGKPFCRTVPMTNQCREVANEFLDCGLIGRNGQVCWVCA